MKHKVIKKAARWLMLGKRQPRSCNEEASTTKDDSGSSNAEESVVIDLESGTPISYASMNSSPVQFKERSPYLPPCDTSSYHSGKSERLNSQSDSNKDRMDAYDEFFHDLENDKESESGDEDLTKKGGYYFDDDFKPSQIDHVEDVPLPNDLVAEFDEEEPPYDSR